MKRNQKGTGAVEGLLILIIVGLIGFIGWYVYHTKNNTDSTYSNASRLSDSATQSSDKYAGWKTYDGKVSDNAQNPAVQADQIAYSFKYPKDWKFYPIGTESTIDGQTGSNSFQEIAPSINSEKAVSFSGIASAKSAKDYYAAAVGDQSGLVGPIWQGLTSFTVNGYSGYTSVLKQGTGNNYETYISNNKNGIVDFHYGEAMASDSATLQNIFSSVRIP